MQLFVCVPLKIRQGRFTQEQTSYIKHDTCTQLVGTSLLTFFGSCGCRRLGQMKIDWPHLSYKVKGWQGDIGPQSYHVQVCLERVDWVASYKFKNIILGYLAYKDSGWILVQVIKCSNLKPTIYSRRHSRFKGSSYSK